jgi:hypothetical protein
VRGSGRSRHQPRSPSYSDAIGALPAFPLCFHSPNRRVLAFQGHRYRTLENVEGYLALYSLQRHYYAPAPATSLNHFVPRSRSSASHLSAPCTQLQSPASSSPCPRHRSCRIAFVLPSLQFSSTTLTHLSPRVFSGVYRVDLIGLSINPSPRALLVYVRTTPRAESPLGRDT